MNKEQFWEIIDKARSEAKTDDEFRASVQEQLMVLPEADIAKWKNYLDKYIEFANTGNLAMACFTINDYLSDDSFCYFRAWLVTQGKDVYMAALADADSLAEVDVEPEGAGFESAMYIPSYAYGAKKLYETDGVRKFIAEYKKAVNETLDGLVEGIVAGRIEPDNPEFKNSMFYSSVYHQIKGRMDAATEVDLYEILKDHALSSGEILEMKGNLTFQEDHPFDRYHLEDYLPQLYEKFQGGSPMMGGI